MNFLQRQAKLRENITFDALLINHLPNIQYLCGFTGSAGFLIVTESGSVFFTDVRYDTQAREEVKGAKVVIARKSVVGELADWVGRQKKSKKWTVGIEAEHLTVAEKKHLSGLLPSGLKLKNTESLVERLRLIKDKDELKLIRGAVKLGADLFDRALETLRPGVKETDVAVAMEYAARLAGASEMSFPTIIASGARSALPHGRASVQAIPAGAFVVCDFGVILADYCSDQTRTVWINKPSSAIPKNARHAYESVREAQQAAITAVRPGVSVGEVDAAARKVLKKAGLGQYFTHSTGHGVGLEIHEIPRVAPGQKEILRPGMVITIEPGVYFPRKWGIRIEDMVVVTESGCEVLTPTSKELVAI
jgi:Xaa-Pro aminopeptidase